MLTSYHLYVDNHAKLTEPDNDLSIISKTIVENYINNRLIWKELYYYQKNKSLLGLHPYFSLQREKTKLHDLSIPDLIKKERALYNTIVRTKKLLLNSVDDKNNKQREDSIYYKSILLKEVRKILNL